MAYDYNIESDVITWICYIEKIPDIHLIISRTQVHLSRESIHLENQKKALEGFESG